MSENDILTEIRERIVRVETKIDNMTDVQNTANRADRTADEANNRAKNAHKRIDKIDKTIFWVSTSIISFVIITGLSLIFTGGN